MADRLADQDGSIPDGPENCCLRGLLHLQWGYMAFPTYAFAVQITATKF